MSIAPILEPVFVAGLNISLEKSRKWKQHFLDLNFPCLLLLVSKLMRKSQKIVDKKSKCCKCKC